MGVCAKQCSAVQCSAECVKQSKGQQRGRKERRAVLIGIGHYDPVRACRARENRTEQNEQGRTGQHRDLYYTSLSSLPSSYSRFLSVGAVAVAVAAAAPASPCLASLRIPGEERGGRNGWMDGGEMREEWRDGRREEEGGMEGRGGRKEEEGLTEGKVRRKSVGWRDRGEKKEVRWSRARERRQRQRYRQHCDTAR